MQLPAGASLGDTYTRPADDMEMVYVPAGEFMMGSTDEEVDYGLTLCDVYFGEFHDCERYWFEDEQPAHQVALDGFWLDRTEVTNAQYARCVAAGACEPPEKRGSYSRRSYYGDSAYDDYPVIYVNRYQAESYCEWADARLPTEAEWEYAARGPERRLFPWGDEIDGTRLNYCDAQCGDFDVAWADESFVDGYADTAPVGSYPTGASWCGALDMAGNVWELVADWNGEYPSGRQENPAGPTSGEYWVVRGGAWGYPWNSARTAHRDYIPLDSRDQLRFVGFRCAASAGE